MKLAFYPGCSLEGMANDYARSILAVFNHLDITLVEIEDWSCCGATAAHSLSENMAVVLPARNLAAAENMGLDIVTPCANCFNRLLFSKVMIQKKIFDVPWTVTGSIQVHEMTRFLARPDMVERIEDTRPQTLERSQGRLLLRLSDGPPAASDRLHRLRKSDDPRPARDRCRCQSVGLVL